MDYINEKGCLCNEGKPSMFDTTKSLDKVETNLGRDDELPETNPHYSVEWRVCL